MRTEEGVRGERGRGEEVLAMRRASLSLPPFPSYENYSSPIQMGLLNVHLPTYSKNLLIFFLVFKKREKKRRRMYRVMVVCNICFPLSSGARLSFA